MYAQQMAKGRAALAKGVYGDLLNAYVYGQIGRTMPPAAPYPQSPAFFQMPGGMPATFSFIPAMAPNQSAEQRYYDFTQLSMQPGGVNAVNGATTNGHRHGDASGYAMTNQMHRDQLIQRNIDIYSQSSDTPNAYNIQQLSPSTLNPFVNPILPYANGHY